MSPEYCLIYKHRTNLRQMLVKWQIRVLKMQMRVLKLQTRVLKLQMRVLKLQTCAKIYSTKPTNLQMRV